MLAATFGAARAAADAVRAGALEHSGFSGSATIFVNIARLGVLAIGARQVWPQSECGGSAVRDVSRAGRNMSVDDNESLDDGQEAGDAFDRRWSNLLDAEADLRSYAEQLLTTGSISIGRAGGVLTAQFTGPVWRYHGFMSWHRRPVLDIDATAAHGSCSGAHGATVNKYRDRGGLIREVMLQRVVSLAFLEEDAALVGVVRIGYGRQPIWTEHWQSI